MSASPVLAAAASGAPRAASPGVAGHPWLLALGLIAFFAGLLVAGLVIAAPGEVPAQLARVRSLIRRPSAPTRSLHTLAEHATQLAERSLDRTGRRGRLERALERAGINARPEEFLVAAVTAGLAGFAVGLLLGGVPVGLILAAVVAVGARVAVTVRAERRQARFGEQLEQTLPLVAGSLRAGFGVMQALDAVARESDAPTSEEFRRLVMETRLGRDLGEALRTMAERVRSEDFEFVVQAIEIHRQVGGDLAEVLDKVASTIRDRNRVRRQVQALSAEGRLSAGILLALPLAMIVIIQLINPGYLAELTGHTLGKVLIAVGLALLVVGGLWMRRLIRLVF